MVYNRHFLELFCTAGAVIAPSRFMAVASNAEMPININLENKYAQFIYFFTLPDFTLFLMVVPSHFFLCFSLFLRIFE